MIDSWLDNFRTEPERIQALYLLSKFVYFGDRQIRQLLRAMYREKFKIPLIAKIRKDLSGITDLTRINMLFQKELSKTRFIGMGAPSESGGHLLYHFRQENQLSKDWFINASDILSPAIKTKSGRLSFKDPSIERYIFIDDFCGSGDQALDYSVNTVEEMKSSNSKVEVYYLVLVGQESGLNRIRSESKFTKVEAIYELDNSFKCFHSESRVFRNPPAGITLKDSQDTSLQYGKHIVNIEHALGYKNSQLLMGFQHNTPDNTLPIIWHQGDERFPWTPIFKRYPKF
tara:strand:+ start:1867 stop:2724 length:858 start_codon:yes stop_codon:yes gene_type:complete